jgi:hypothetical protein
MGDASADSMAPPDQMAKMNAQMKATQDMRDKMMNAKTPAERSALMAEHRKTMQDGMQLMGDMRGMQGMTGGMGAHNQAMARAWR